MKVSKVPNERPQSPGTPVTLKITGNIMEIRYARSNFGSPVRKVDADHGIDVRTGELIAYRHKTNRAESKGDAAQSLKRLRDLINTNLVNPDRALWVTLTYSENMTDTVQLYEDYRRFWQRFCYHLKKHSLSSAEYIIAAEPQGRGAWHLHCLFLFPAKRPYIPNADIARIWGHGFTKTKSLKGIGNPGLYLSAYLSDMELAEAISAGITKGHHITEAEIADEQGRNHKKAVIKGARLKLYPPGFNLYRCSRGVKQPTVYKTTEGKAQAFVGSTPLTYEKTVAVTDESGAVKNVVNYRVYTRGTEPASIEGQESGSEEAGTTAGTPF